MNINLENNSAKGRAFVVINNETKAAMTYSKAGSNLLIIDHTEVGDELRGQGVGRKLLDKIVDYARSNQFKILPLCPYAKSVFDKDASIGDVLKEKG